VNDIDKVPAYKVQRGRERKVKKRHAEREREREREHKLLNNTNKKSKRRGKKCGFFS
jgi:hypothetical protein